MLTVLGVLPQNERCPTHSRELRPDHLNTSSVRSVLECTAELVVARFIALGELLVVNRAKTEMTARI